MQGSLTHSLTHCSFLMSDQYPSIMWETFEKLGSQLQERKEKPDFESIVADGLELRPRLSRLFMMYYDVYDVEPHVFLPSERNRMSMMQHEEAGTPLLAFYETWKGGCCQYPPTSCIFCPLCIPDVEYSRPESEVVMMMMIWSKPRLGVGRWSRCVGPSLCRSTHGQATVNPQPS